MELKSLRAREPTRSSAHLKGYSLPRKGFHENLHFAVQSTCTQKTQKRFLSIRNRWLCDFMCVFCLFLKAKAGAQLTTSLPLMADHEKRLFGARHGVFSGCAQGRGVHRDAYSKVRIIFFLL